MPGMVVALPSYTTPRDTIWRQLVHVAMKLLRPTFFARMQQPNQTLIDLASIAASSAMPSAPFSGPRKPVRPAVHQRDGRFGSGAVTPEGTPVLREAHVTRFANIFEVSGMIAIT